MKTIKHYTKLFALTTLCCLLASAGEASNERKDFLCSTKPDPLFGKCAIQVNAITQTTNGQQQKGHLVFCQQTRAYSCLGKECEELYGRDPKKVTHNLGMTDYTGFCGLLCKSPVCAGQWVEKK